MGNLKQAIPYPEITTATRDTSYTSVVVNFTIKNIDLGIYQQWNGTHWVEVFNPSLLRDESAEVIQSESKYLDFVNPNRISQQAHSGGLTAVDSLNSSWTKYSTTDFGDPHGMVIVGDFLFISTRQFPARLLKLNKHDLSIEEVLTFPGPNMDVADSLVYSKYKDKLYIAFGDYPGDGRMLNVVEINPYDLTDYTVQIDETGNTGYEPGFPKVMVQDNVLVVITTKSTGGGKVIEYDLDDYSRTNQIDIPVTGVEVVSSSAMDGDFVYLAEVYGSAAIKKLSRSTWTFVDNYPVLSDALASNMALVGDYIWVASLNSVDSGADTNRGIYRINKHNLADYAQIYVDDLEDNWGCHYDGKYIWAPIKKSPAELLRINPLTLEVKRTIMPIGENLLNKMVFDRNHLFFTTFENPCKVIKLSNITEFTESYLATADNDVLMHINYLTKIITGDFIDSTDELITSVTYAQLVALIIGSNLIPRHNYRITDFKFRHLITNTTVINEGTTEVLVVRALTNNTLEQIAYSESHLNDLIYYVYSEDIIAGHDTYLENDTTGTASDEVSAYSGITDWDKETYPELYFEVILPSGYRIIAYPTSGDRTAGTNALFYVDDGSTAIVEQNSSGFGGTLTYTRVASAVSDEFDVTYQAAERTGYITRRIDLGRNIDIATDWRNYKVRINTVTSSETYSSGNSYSVGQIIKDSDDLYKVTKAGVISSLTDALTYGVVIPWIDSSLYSMASLYPSTIGGQALTNITNNIGTYIDANIFSNISGYTDLTDDNYITNIKISKYQDSVIVKTAGASVQLDSIKIGQLEDSVLFFTASVSEVSIDSLFVSYFNISSIIHKAKFGKITNSVFTGSFDYSDVNQILSSTIDSMLAAKGNLINVDSNIHLLTDCIFTSIGVSTVKMQDSIVTEIYNSYLCKATANTPISNLFAKYIITGSDCSAATYLYSDTSKEYIKNYTGSLVLSYYDTSNNLTFVAITA